MDGEEGAAADSEQVGTNPFGLSVGGAGRGEAGPLLWEEVVSHGLQQQLATLPALAHQRLRVHVVHEELTRDERQAHVPQELIDVGFPLRRLVLDPGNAGLPERKYCGNIG